MAEIEVVIIEADVPQAPGHGLKATNPEAPHSSNLGVKTIRFTTTVPLEHLVAIDQAAASVGAARPWALRAMIRQFVEDGELVTSHGRARVSDYLKGGKEV